MSCQIFLTCIMQIHKSYLQNWSVPDGLRAIQDGFLYFTTTLLSMYTELNTTYYMTLFQLYTTFWADCCSHHQNQQSEWSTLPSCTQSAIRQFATDYYVHCRLCGSNSSSISSVYDGLRHSTTQTHTYTQSPRIPLSFSIPTPTGRIFIINAMQLNSPTLQSFY